MEVSGIFKLEDCVTLQQLADAYWLWKELSQPEALLRIIHPIEKLLLDYPSVTVKDSAAAALSHGAPLLRPGIVSIDPAMIWKGSCHSNSQRRGSWNCIAHARNG